MNKIISLLSLLALTINSLLYAQNLGLSGIITFERKENMHKAFSEENSWNEARLKSMPKYKTDQFQLHFNAKHSIYKISVEDESPFFTWVKVANANTVKKDLQASTYEAEKTIYEKTYHLKDSLPIYQWKLMGEFRNIAGFNCRKASTIILDSIYIIAFYTDELPVGNGPEAFNGLPGMILGIVIPRLNLTYFATKVETQTLPVTVFEFPMTKSKIKTFQEFNLEISKALKDWGEYGTKVLWKGNL
jgi:GLPGLI family protein